MQFIFGFREAGEFLHYKVKKLFLKTDIKIKRRDWDLNPGEDDLTGFQVLRLTRLDYLGI